MLDFHRLEAIGLLRCLGMVLMALDHTRDFFSDALYSPTDLDKTSAGISLTRWVTLPLSYIILILTIDKP